MNTIDILDECLNISYQMRKSSIKSRKYKPKGGSSVGEKPSFRMDDKVVPKGRYIPPKHYAEIIETLPNKRFRVRWIHDDEIAIFESHALKMWNPGKKDYFEDEDEDGGPNISSNMNMSSPDKKPAAGAGIKRQSSAKKMTVEFATVESQQDDMLAQKTFDAFKDELNEWWLDNALRRDDEDLRGQVADDFTEVLTHSQSLTHSLTHSLTITHLLTHSLTHSLTYLLTYSLTDSLTHLLTYLLTH
jgi:hypothetical protein